jgi:type IV secretion system protein VirB10
MRSLFSGPSADEPVSGAAPTNGGWNGLSGRSKLGILGAVSIAAITAVMWPGFNTRPSQPTGPQDQHPPARISDYEPPPPVQDVAARVMNDAPVAPARRGRPVPTEMALYTAPKAAITSLATQAPATPSVAATDPTAGLPPTNHATLVHNPDYLIRAGDVIPCLPIDAQNSSRPSFSTCQVPIWFRSSNQRRGLLPPHSRMFGQIRTGLQAGEERLGIVYSLIQTPNFNMPIAAPAGDAMGRGGVDGDVNTFFWDRAGAVGLYALMDMGVGIGQSLAQTAVSNSFRGTGGYGPSINIQGPSQSLAARQFDATINKPPVLTRDQALPITVTVGQDLDFYDACMQAQRVDPMACPKQ